MGTEARFDEKILYRTHQHWIVLLLNSLKHIGIIAIPSGFFGYLIFSGSGIWTFSLFLGVSLCAIFYNYYLWHHSWLLIGNQKITLTVRNGIFSQYAMNIRYRNIRDSAVSKNNIFGYLLKYGSLFVRSSANEGDFQAHFVPKVGKVFAIVNALSRYSDDERTGIHSIEELHDFHQKKEFSNHNTPDGSMTKEEATTVLLALPGISQVLEVSEEAKKFIRSHEEVRNSGIFEVISRDYVLVFLHEDTFRNPEGNIVEKNAKGEIFFPSIPFPEIRGKRVVSASPSESVHRYLLKFFPYSEAGDATVLVGWDK